MKRRMTTRLALGALAAALAAPALAQDDGRFGWLTSWIPPSSTTIDMVNGNDFRDNRDSTISRNDVTRDQTTLTERQESWRSSESMSDTSGPYSATESMGTALPATAAANADPGPAVDDVVQHNETIINESPDPSLAAEQELRRSGAVAGNGNDVTSRNTGGVAQVRDGIDRDVYTGVEGAGGTGALTAARDSEEPLVQ